MSLVRGKICRSASLPQVRLGVGSCNLNVVKPQLDIQQGNGEVLDGTFPSALINETHPRTSRVKGQEPSRLGP